MAMAYLGERVDVHVGGVDHVPVHHTNEIAQSEAALGHPWVGTWMHCQFLTMDRAKMSKSKGGFLRLADLEERGFRPVHYRYFCLGAHYRSAAPFSWEALESARAAFENLKNKVVRWRLESPPSARPRPGAGDAYRERFSAAVRDDVNVPVALSVLWEAAGDASLAPVEKRSLALDADRVLGLGLEALRRPDVAPEVARRIEEREDARRRSDFARADAVRDALRVEGIEVRDTPDGPDWYARD
jgi:cysteinyl-tRNA synthetase